MKAELLYVKYSDVFGGPSWKDLDPDVREQWVFLDYLLGEAYRRVASYD
jgi:hypothetical protein